MGSMVAMVAYVSDDIAVFGQIYNKSAISKESTKTS